MGPKVVPAVPLVPATDLVVYQRPSYVGTTLRNPPPPLVGAAPILLNLDRAKVCYSSQGPVGGAGQNTRMKKVAMCFVIQLSHSCPHPSVRSMMLEKTCKALLKSWTIQAPIAGLAMAYDLTPDFNHVAASIIGPLPIVGALTPRPIIFGCIRWGYECECSTASKQFQRFLPRTNPSSVKTPWDGAPTPGILGFAPCDVVGFVTFAWPGRGDDQAKQLAKAAPDYVILRAKAAGYWYGNLNPILQVPITQVTGVLASHDMLQDNTQHQPRHSEKDMFAADAIAVTMARKNEGFFEAINAGRDCYEAKVGGQKWAEDLKLRNWVTRLLWCEFYTHKPVNLPCPKYPVNNYSGCYEQMWQEELQRQKERRTTADNIRCRAALSTILSRFDDMRTVLSTPGPWAGHLTPGLTDLISAIDAGVSCMAERSPY